MAGPDFVLLANLNNQRKQQKKGMPGSLVLKNVKFFNGHEFVGPKDVYIKDGWICEIANDVEELDCSGKYLIPGLIDCHTHPTIPRDLENLTKYGVTTTMSMAGFLKEHMASLKGHDGLVDVLVAGTPAAGPDNLHVKMQPYWPQEDVLTKPSQANDFVENQIAKGADFIKIIADVPGLDQEIVTALVRSAKDQQKLTVCHAATRVATRIALQAGTDQIHHSPLDSLLDEDDIQYFLQSGCIICPTLTMMEGVVRNLKRPGQTYESARDCVILLHKAGVPILCGTDANEAPGVPASVSFGRSIHRELELLTEAGLSNIEALQAATSLPAKHFGLKDRGAILPGLRADLVLLSENPISNIAVADKIEKVWVKGVEYVSSPI
jgi:imidazolonepropionase-like amidohydrolase